MARSEARFDASIARASSGEAGLSMGARSCVAGIPHAQPAHGIPNIALWPAHAAGDVGKPTLFAANVAVCGVAAIGLRSLATGGLGAEAFREHRAGERNRAVAGRPPGRRTSLERAAHEG
jgi:hypothetical protein